MPSKRRRTSNPGTQADSTSLPGRDRFSRLPLELLAEILSSTSSKDVLAVARCSKSLCNILVDNESTEFIWRSARKQCKPYPLRNPTPNFTEASYAAFVFDFGNCEICGNATKEPFFSFSLRLRICRKTRCHDGMSSKLDLLIHRSPQTPEYYAVRKWLPRGEYASLGRYNVHTGTQRPQVYRSSDCERAMSEVTTYLNNGGTLEQYVAQHSWDARKREIVLEHSEHLVNWWRERAALAHSIVANNKNFARKYADEHAWDVQDLFNSATYKELAKTSECRLEQLSQSDLNRQFTALATEVTRAKDNRLRRQEEKLYSDRRQAIEKFYRNLENKHSRAEWPLQLSIFRQLPVITSLQDRAGLTAEQLLKEIDDVGVKKFCEMNIRAWRDQTERRFSKLLGVPAKRYTDFTRLKVFQRATSLYLCKECSKEGHKTAPTSLSFVEACRHHCSVQKSSKKTAAWSVDKFIADKKATAVVRQVLGQLGKEEDETKADDLRSLGDVIRCITCEGNIVLSYDLMIQHCHRHDAMQVEVTSADIAKRILQKPIPHGYAKELYGRKPSSRKKRERHLYGCRHCLQFVPPLPNFGNDAYDLHNLFSLSRMTFDGLRAHAKTRHHIDHIADEDYIVYSRAGKFV